MFRCLLLYYIYKQRYQDQQNQQQKTNINMASFSNNHHFDNYRINVNTPYTPISKMGLEQSRPAADKEIESYAYAKYGIDLRNNMNNNANVDNSSHGTYRFQKNYKNDNQNSIRNQYQRHYHSKEMNNKQQIEGKENNQKDTQFRLKRGAQDVNQPYKRQLRLSHSPSFRKPDSSLNTPNYFQKQHEFIDSIDNAVQSHRSRYSQQSSYREACPASSQSQQQLIIFLKQKVVQMHHKLMKQLQNTNRLSFELETLQQQYKQEQKEKHQALSQVQRYKKQNEILNDKLDQNFHKQQAKNRNIQSILKQQQKRNNQLKEDLQMMRNKMLQIIMQKNNLEQQLTHKKRSMQDFDKIIQKLNKQNLQLQQEVQYLRKQSDAKHKKYLNLQTQTLQRSQQLHQYSHLAAQRQKVILSLQSDFKAQKERHTNLLLEYNNLQGLYKENLNKIQQLQEQIYELKQNKEDQGKNYSEKLLKVTQQFNILNRRLIDKQRQLQNYKKSKPINQQRKKKDFQNTKQFVHKLQTEQSYIQNSRFVNNEKARSKQSANKMSSLNKQSSSLSPTTRNNSSSKSPAHIKNSNYLETSAINVRNENIITHQPINSRDRKPNYNKSKKQKQKFITTLSQIGQLQTSLLNHRQKKKKMLEEVDKIDATKVKTKDIINKRKKLEQEITQQQNKIKILNQQIHKFKVL